MKVTKAIVFKNIIVRIDKYTMSVFIVTLFMIMLNYISCFSMFGQRENSCNFFTKFKFVKCIGACLKLCIVIPLRHRLFLDQSIIFMFRQHCKKKIMKINM